jgi:hypothetical protein
MGGVEMTSYLFRGFSRADDNIRVSVIVDGDDTIIGFDDARARAEKIAGPDYCVADYGIGITRARVIPDTTKNRLFMSDAEFRAAVPELANKEFEAVLKKAEKAAAKAKAKAEAEPPKRKAKLPTTFHRGFAVTGDDAQGYTVIHNGAPVGPFPDKNAAYNWINEEAKLREPAKSPGAKLSSSSVATGVTYTCRGFEYTGDARGYTITKDGVVLAGPLPTQDAVISWIEAKRQEAATREAKPSSSIEPPAVKPRNPSIVPTKKSDDQSITLLEYGGLQAAYDHFDRVLFDGELPFVLLNLERKANSAGYFAADRFNYRADGTKEHVVALNPDGFLGRPDEDACQTLVHEIMPDGATFERDPTIAPRTRAARRAPLVRRARSFRVRQRVADRPIACR